MLKGNCEVFNNKRCFGCEALARDDIDILKKQCDVYKTESKEMVQIEIPITNIGGIKNDNL